MEIRSTSPDDPKSTSTRIDITRQNREAIQSRQPLPPKPVEPSLTPDPAVKAKEVLVAREQHRAQHQGRIANARLNYTANHADARAKEIAGARDVYEARIDKSNERRTDRVANQTPATASTDKLELSDASKLLAQFDLGSKTDDQARTERVADLKKLYESGALNTSDLIARTSYRLLGGK
jgi:anti-sigma28 factor (negative regulator of flagellin synthesis)